MKLTRNSLMTLALLLSIQGMMSAQGVRFDADLTTINAGCAPGQPCPAASIPGTLVTFCSGQSQGFVNTSGTSVTLISGVPFSLSQTGTLNIGGAPYTIQTVNNPTSITLTATAGTQTGAAYSSLTACIASPATTYTDSTSVTPCPTTAQLTPQGGGTCRSTAELDGNAGGWFLPGQYSYYVQLPATAGGRIYGPYPFSAGARAGCPLGGTCDANYATLAMACSAAESGTLYVTRTWNATPSQELACGIEFSGKGKIQVAANAVVKINGPVTCPAYQQCFDTTTNAGASISFSRVANVGGTWFGASNDGSDATGAIHAAIAAACASVTSRTGATVTFPNTGSGSFLVSSTLNLCGQLEVKGDTSKIHYTGAGPLFSIPLSKFGSIHGMVLEGEGSAGQWWVKIAGTAGNGALNEDLYDNQVYNFGVAGGGSANGGGIWVNGDSAALHVHENFIAVQGTGLLGLAPTDSLHVENNLIAPYVEGIDSGFCVDLGPGQSGAAAISVSHNNLQCSGGAIRMRGFGVYLIDSNEYEGTARLSNPQAAAYVLVNTGGSAPFVKFNNNYAGIHGYGSYCFWVDPATSNGVFTGNDCSMASTESASQYGWHNPQSLSSAQPNIYEANTVYAIAGAANLYDNPASPEIRLWPPSSTHLTDATSLFRGSPSSYSVVAAVSAASWSRGTNLVTYTTAAAHSLISGQLVTVLDTVAQPSAAAVSAKHPLGYNTYTLGCTVTVTSATQFTCPLSSDPGTYVSGGAIYTFTQFNAAVQDVLINPGTGGGQGGLTTRRHSTGAIPGDSWGVHVQNSGATDSRTGIFETSSDYTEGGVFRWIGDSMTGLYFPSRFRLGTGTGITPVMLSNGPGKTGFGGIPIYANNAAALAGGLTAGMFYRSGTDPDQLYIVH